MICSIDGCASRVLARGWCAKHYSRWQRHGDPLLISRTSPIEPGAIEKLCPRCSTVKPLAEFGARRGKVGEKPRGYCWPCEKEYLRARNNGPKNAVRREVSRRSQQRNRGWRLMKLYGLTVEEYDAMRDRQGNRCAICKTEEVGGNANHWHVDHDHATGRVRGLLCQRCNMLLGYAKDDHNRLLAAVEYLTGMKIGSVVYDFGAVA